MAQRILVVASVLALLGGCGESGGSAESGTKVATIGVGAEYNERLKALGDRDRNLTLMRAIRDSGEQCRAVERSAYQGPYENLQMWTAECRDRRSWAVFIAPDASVQVRACTDAAELGLPECELPADEAAG